MNSGLDRFVTIRSIVAQGRPGHDATDLILVKAGAKRRRASPPLDLCYLNVRGRDTSAPELIRSIQAVYLKRDGAVSVVHRVADLEEAARLRLQHHGVVGIERCVDQALSKGHTLGHSKINRKDKKSN